MLAGEGADRFAKSQGLEIVDNMYFATPKTLKWIEDLKRRARRMELWAVWYWTSKVT